MSNKKRILLIATVICVLLVFMVLILPKDNEDIEEIGAESSLVSVEQAMASFNTSIDQANYANLNIHDFKVSLDNVKTIHNIRLLKNNKYEDNTFLDDFERMNKVIDNFFNEDFDKSYITATFASIPNRQEDIVVPYNRIEKQCVSSSYDDARIVYLFGNNTSKGGYMVQTDKTLSITWLSRYGFGDIHPATMDYSKMYKYISCQRQNEDIKIKLKDGEIDLSKLEEKVLSYVNQDFVQEIPENISYGVSDVRIIDLENYEGACFKLRRIYKDVPFEYGSNIASGEFIDRYLADSATIGYVESSRPDTIVSFGNTNIIVEETDTITEMLPVDKALDILSKKIGENSTYNVHYIELVYRHTVLVDDLKDDECGVLRPMWKFTTKNKIDDKYTIFYVDVVTGDITQRFEYSYE